MSTPTRPPAAPSRAEGPAAGAPDADALSVAPGLGDAVAAAESASAAGPTDDGSDEEGAADSRSADYAPADARTVAISLAAVVLAAAAALAAQVLLRLIALATNLAFYGRLATAAASPAGAHRGPAATLLIPILGALVVGVMARYGSAAIRGHGIPEVMERVLYGESRISWQVLLFKPLSAAVAIGTGGPFGAEGPIIATGGALGSLAGQRFPVSADERKVLLAAGAAAGMAATFGSPVSAVLLAVELLLFEYRPRSLIPVALAAATAAAVRALFDGTGPVFPIPTLAPASPAAFACYTLLGAAVGAVAAGVTRVTYGVEDAFERAGHRLGVHWMWWPAAGALVVGLVGLVEPRALGVGYDNITGAIAGTIVGRALLVLVVAKFVAWAVYLGSGTSGGTLAPLFTLGSGIGALGGSLVAAAAPGLGVDPRVAGLVGMAAMFAGASHALLASVVFAFETTRQPAGLLPLLAGCSAAYLVSLLLGRHSIMTFKLARRGASVRAEYAADPLAGTFVREALAAPGRGAPVTLGADDALGAVRAWVAAGAPGSAHQGFPVLDAAGRLAGVVTRRDLLDPAHDDARRVGALVRRPAVVTYPDHTLRDAGDRMVEAGVGRLPVVERGAPGRVIGIVTRSDLLAAHAPRLRARTVERRERRQLTPGARPPRPPAPTK